MLTTIPDVPDGILALEATGTVTAQDFVELIEPEVERMGRMGRRLRILLRLGDAYEGFTAGAVLEKTELWARHPTLTRSIEGYALVSDIRWVGDLVHLAGLFLPFPMRVFDIDDLDGAVAWLGSLPLGVSHRVVGSRALLVEVERPLQAADFEAVAATADSFIAEHGRPPGLVVHARRFPGWENIAGLLGHARFVRDRARRLPRVALAADGAPAPVVARLARLARRLGAPEVRAFGYDDLDAALAWVGAEVPPARSTGIRAVAT